MDACARPNYEKIAVSSFSLLFAMGTLLAAIPSFNQTTAVALTAFVGLGMSFGCLQLLSLFTGTEIGASGRPIFHEILLVAVAVIVAVTVPMWALGQIHGIIEALLLGFCSAMLATTGQRRRGPKSWSFHLGMMGMTVSYCVIVYLTHQKFA